MIINKVIMNKETPCNKILIICNSYVFVRAAVDPKGGFLFLDVRHPRNTPDFLLHLIILTTHVPIYKRFDVILQVFTIFLVYIIFQIVINSSITFPILSTFIISTQKIYCIGDKIYKP